ncbi:MAG: PEGA domain-containing protein [Clostridiales bacterium]|jgi:hypothetical protein|nr:PEGA domain-containing protein [Clostridiales bacterium]
MDDHKNSREKDGVIYTPGSAYDKTLEQARRGTQSLVSRQTGGRSAAPAAASRTRTRRKRAKKREKSQYGVFLSLTIFTGVAVALIVFALVFSTFLDNSSGGLFGGEDKIPKPKQEAELPLTGDEKADGTFVVKKAEPQGGALTLYSPDAKQTLNLLTGQAPLKNKYGEPIVFSEIKRGDIVDAVYSGARIDELNLSTKSSEYKGITNLSADTVDRKITIGNNVFNYDDELVCTDGDGSFDIADLTARDVVTLRVYKDYVCSVTLDQGHGFIEFVTNRAAEVSPAPGAEGVTPPAEPPRNLENSPIEGSIEIDNDTIVPISEAAASPVPVREGRHRIVVKAKDHESYNTEVDVERGQTATVDLTEMKLNVGILSVKANKTDYSIFIEGRQYPATEPIELSYGQHGVVVRKDGCVPWEGSVTIDKKVNNLSVTLEEDVKMCRFTVTSRPDKAEIYIDNSFIGVSPCSANVEYGSHSLTYKKQGYKSVSYDVTLNTPALSYDLILLEEAPLQ